MGYRSSRRYQTLRVPWYPLGGVRNQRLSSSSISKFKLGAENLWFGELLLPWYPPGGVWSRRQPPRLRRWGYQGTTLRVRRTPPKGVLEQPGKGASEGYAFEPLFRLYFYHWNGAWNPLSNNRASWSFFALVTIVTFKPFSLVNSIFCSISRNR